VSPRPTPRGDDGAATVEFVLVGLLLLVPLAYVVLTALSVQRTAFGTVEAARSGARAFVTAPSGATGRSRAVRAVDLALADQGVRGDGAVLQITCGATPCLTPGATLRVRVSAIVRLPWLPSFLGGDDGGIPVQAVHVEVVDPFEPARS
jgi:hypothetical protein